MHPPRPRPAAAGRLPPLLVPAFVALVALVLARSAMLPGIWFWDTAEAQTVAPVLGVMHPTGFPAYVILGWLASVVLQPFGEPAFRMNLLSGLLIATAAATLVILVRRLGVPTLVAAAAGIGFAATPLPWRMATFADVHPLHVAIVAVLLLMLVRWEQAALRAREAGENPGRADRRLVLAAAVCGAALANHQLTLLLGLPILLYVAAVDRTVFRRPRTVLAAAGACLGVAGMLYLELPLRSGPFPAPLVYGRPDTLEGLRYIVLAEQFRGSLQHPFTEGLQPLADLARRAWVQFGLLAPLLPAAFAATAILRPRYALLTGSAAAITLAFNASYVNADIERYDLGPVLLAWTWLAVLGGAAADRIAPGPAGARRSLPAMLVAALLLAPTAIELPSRHAAVDRSGDRTAREWLDTVLHVLEPDAVVVSWWSYSTPLWYGQLIEGRRPDITVIDDRARLDQRLGGITDVIDAHLGQRPVYVTRPLPQEIEALDAAYVLELVPGTDVLFRVVSAEPFA